MVPFCGTFVTIALVPPTTALAQFSECKSKVTILFIVNIIENTHTKHTFIIKVSKMCNNNVQRYSL